MDSYTYRQIDKCGSDLLNTLLSEYIHKLPNKDIRKEFKRKENIQEKKRILKQLIVEDPEFLKSTAEYLYTVSGYGSDNEELLQEWHGKCPYRDSFNFGECCEYCRMTHHALETEGKCKCLRHRDRPSIYMGKKL